ncbi:MAG TPA: energy-coupling factor transporter transmembrane component T [Gemmatimonadales bacterium]|nr:energy-coupling factor transporter transmembrane component T [Gemmatimonadales bacterium]
MSARRAPAATAPVAGAVGLALRAHPFTPFVVALAVALLAFLLPGPWGPVALYGVVLALAGATGVGGAARTALLVCLPLWLFLFLLHGVLGEGPRVAAGPLRLSAAGLALALAQAGRFGAIATASLGLLRAFRPSRFLDAAAARGWPFHLPYLLVATLQAGPRLRHRAGLVLEAQRTRGLRYGGSPLARLRALGPVVLPLVLGALAEVDDRAMALETRGLGAAGHGAVARTPLDPPRDTAGDRLVRWGAALAVLAALVWRVLAWRAAR